MSTHRAIMEKHHLVIDPSLKCAKCPDDLRLWTDYRMGDLPGNDTFICEICHQNPDPMRRYHQLEVTIFFAPTLNLYPTFFLQVVNTPYNRYNCFKCDYDICSSCAKREYM